MKKVLSLVLVLTLVLGSFSFAFAAEPTDNEKVNALIELGLVFGDASGYRLNDTITRAEAATMVVRTLDLESVAQASKYASSFKDVGANHWALGYINVAAGRGIVNGYPDGTFKPDANISYAEIITMMVQVLGGLNEQEAKAPWPANMITKASELGILKDVAIANFAEVAVREKVFELVYNTRFSEKTGVYQIIKAIVLENYRVESIDKADVVVEVIREVQKGDFAEQSRKEKGDQFRIEIPAKLGDVENLLGKVVDLSIDKNGNVVKVEIDNSYKYLVGAITKKDAKSLELDYDKYTVQLDERYDKADERVFRTYFNNDAMKYEDFYKKSANPEYARITVKNGKVLFIDAFQFDDIAPVKEVKNDGKVVYIYDDVRDGAVKKLEFDSKTKVVLIKDKEMNVGSLEDIEAMDVIHYVDNTVFVRQDATVEGTYEKYTTAKIDDQDTVKIYVDGKAYTAGFAGKRTAVFATDGEEDSTFLTLERNRVSANLEKIKGKEVTVLLDMNNRVQYIASGIKDPSFIALFEQANKGDARFVKADNEKEVYSSTFDTKYVNANGTTKLQNLYSFNVGDLVKVEAKDADIAKLTLVRTRNYMVNNSVEVKDMTKAEIELNGGSKFYIEPSTKVFINVLNPNGTYTLKGITAADLLKNYKVKQNTNGTYNAKVYVEANTKDARVADILVFTLLTDADVLRDAYVRKVVEIEGYDLYNYYMVLEDTAGERTTHYIDKDDAKGIRAGDIIRVNLTRDDDKEIYDAPTVLVSWNAPVYKVTKISGRTYTLADKHGVTQTRYLLSTASVFGEPGVDEYVAIPTSNNGDAINVMVEKTYYAGWHASAPYGEWTTVNPPVTGQGIVTYINKTRMELDDKDVVVIDADTKLVNAAGTTIAIGADAIDGKIAVGDQVKVDKNVITLVLTKAQVDAAKLVNTNIKNSTLKVDTLTIADKAAVAALENAYNALTDAQKAFVEKAQVDKLKALVAKIAELEAPVNAEKEAVKAIVMAVAGNDKAALATALANPKFTQSKVVAANMDAYLASAEFRALSLTSRAADVDSALDTVNAAEAEKAAVKAVVVAVAGNDKAALATALANPVFTQSKVVAANMDAYLAHVDFKALTLTSTAANVDTALNKVNQDEVDKVAAAIPATFAANGAAGEVKMPTVPAGYTIAVKTSSDATKYDTAGKIVADGSSTVVYTVTHTQTALTKDTGNVTVTVTVTP